MQLHRTRGFFIRQSLNKLEKGERHRISQNRSTGKQYGASMTARRVHASGGRPCDQTPRARTLQHSFVKEAKTYAELIVLEKLRAVIGRGAQHTNCALSAHIARHKPLLLFTVNMTASPSEFLARSASSESEG